MPQPEYKRLLSRLRRHMTEDQLDRWLTPILESALLHAEANVAERFLRGRRPKE